MFSSLFWRDHNGNATATLLFCVIPTIAPYIDYIKIRVENFHLCDCKWTRTHNLLYHKRTLNHSAKLASLAKWLSVPLWTKWLSIWVKLQSFKFQISSLLWARSSLTFRQLQSVDSLWNAYVTWQENTVNFHLYLLII